MSRVTIAPGGSSITIVPQPPRPVTIQRSGIQGRKGDQGDTGYPGWSPVLAAVADGERRVVQISGWTGGEGSEPASGGYIGSSGIVSDITAAIDIRGERGSTDISQCQPLDATLTALAAVTTAADQMIYATGADAFSTIDFPAFGRGLASSANVAALWAAIGIIGTVTQSGGVPTGPLFQRGSVGGQGEFIRLANGFQVCWLRNTSIAVGGTTWIFPAAFSAQATTAVFAASTNTSTPRFIVANNSSASASQVQIFDSAGASISAGVSLFALGWWF